MIYNDYLIYFSFYEWGVLLVILPSIVSVLGSPIYYNRLHRRHAEDRVYAKIEAQLDLAKVWRCPEWSVFDHRWPIFVQLTEAEKIELWSRLHLIIKSPSPFAGLAHRVYSNGQGGLSTDLYYKILHWREEIRPSEPLLEVLRHTKHLYNYE